MRALAAEKRLAAVDSKLKKEESDSATEEEDDHFPDLRFEDFEVNLFL